MISSRSVTDGVVLSARSSDRLAHPAATDHRSDICRQGSSGESPPGGCGVCQLGDFLQAVFAVRAWIARIG